MLRPYQKDALKACIESETGGCVISPTGSGKSHIIAELCHHFNDQDVLVITPRRELMEQNAQKIYSNAQCMTVNKAYKDLIQSEILIIDECHLVRQFDGMYHTLMGLSHKVYGFTATPFRLDCGHLVPNVFKKCLYKIDREELVSSKYLSLRQHQPIPHDRLINVKNNSFQSVRKLSDDSCPHTHRCIDHYLTYGESDEQALVFVCDIRHAKVTQEYLPHSKIIHGQLPKAQRTQIIKEFKNGTLQYLINCEILTTGFDHPPLQNIVILRPTDSYSLYEQICGRGDRIYEGKKYNKIWDYTINSFCFEGRKTKEGNYKRYCIYCMEITDYRLRNCQHCHKALVKGEAPTKECAQCGEDNFPCATYCRGCGMFIKANVRSIRGTKDSLKWHKHGYMKLNGVNFKTQQKTMEELKVKLQADISYIFYYKWNNYRKTNVLLEIRLDTS